MEKYNLTHKWIEKQASAERVHFHDREIPNFGVRIEGDRKTFFYSCKINGRHYFRSLGCFPGVSMLQARESAKALAGRIATWKLSGCPATPPEANPFYTAKRGGPLKFSDMYERYITEWIRAEANRPEDRERYLRWLAEKYLGTIWSKRADEVHAQDVVVLRNSFGDKKHMSNRVVEVIKAVYGWASKPKDGQAPVFTGANPAASVELHSEEGRERFLSPEELARLYDNLDSEPSQDLRDYLVVALDTGVRKMGILSAKWENVSLQQELWTIPSSDSKSGDSYNVTLSPDVVKIFARRLREKPDSEYIFPGRSGGHRSDLYAEWDSFRKRSGFSDVRLHDLRRTCGANLAISGASPFVVKEVLGHSSLAAVEFYARLNREAVKKALATSRQASRRAMAAVRKGTKELQAVNS